VEPELYNSRGGGVVLVAFITTSSYLSRVGMNTERYCRLPSCVGKLLCAENVQRRLSGSGDDRKEEAV
jgi:hypothetical protein